MPVPRTWNRTKILSLNAVHLLQAMWNCIAAYHPTALDALTKDRPVLHIPSKYHTSEARALCMIHAVNKLIPDLVPIAAESIMGWLDSLGLESEIMSDVEARHMAIMHKDISPRVVGSVVAANILDDMKTDGWNYDGSMTPKGACTANCRPFSDTTGYIPKNSPWTVTEWEKWQPLIESDENGFFYAQEHVTPHIGFTAKPAVLTRTQIDARNAPDPMYDYDKETQDVIDRVAQLTPFQRDMIAFNDNKINIAGGMM